MPDYYVTLSQSGKPIVDFRLQGGPIEDPQRYTELFAAIGLAATAWARFEAHLDALLIHVNAYEHSSEIYNPEHPVTFDRKVKLLKRWFNQHPALAPLSQDMRDLTSRAKALGKMRNDLLHYILEDFDANTKTANFHGLKWMGNDTFHANRVEFTVEGLGQFTSIVNKGNNWLEQMSRSLFTHEALAQLQTPSQRIPRLVRLFRRWRARLGF